MCSRCGTVNPLGSVICKKCSQELLKICPHCNGVNFPDALKCRKCGLALEKKQPLKSEDSPLEFAPKFFTRKQALDILTDGLLSRDKKIFSIAGEKGIGKSSLLKEVKKNLEKQNFQWCIGKCTPLTQLTPGGVIQDMLLNVFKLPDYCINNEDLQKNALQFFGNEFKFLKQDEISDFINFDTVSPTSG